MSADIIIDRLETSVCVCGGTCSHLLNPKSGIARATGIMDTGVGIGLSRRPYAHHYQVASTRTVLQVA